MRIVTLAMLLLFLIVCQTITPCHAADRTIAVMMSSDQPRYREAHRAFIKLLTARGHIGSGTEIILQAPNPDPLSWTNTIRKFAAYKPDLIVVYGASAAMVALKESEGIPVVAVDVYATEKPDRSMAGVSSRVPMVTLLKTLHSIKPFQRVGVLFNSREVGSLRQFEDIKRYAGQYGISVVEGNVSTAAALENALNSMPEKVDAIVVTESGLPCRAFDRIIARARAKGVPVVSTMPDAAEKGALVSLEINPQEQGHLAADIAARILEGAKSDSLGLLSPKRIDLIINMRSAKEMNLSVPFPVLGTATRLLK